METKKRVYIYVEQHQPAGVIMWEALWACIVHEMALYIKKNPLLYELKQTNLDKFYFIIFLENMCMICVLYIFNI